MSFDDEMKLHDAMDHICAGGKNPDPDRVDLGVAMLKQVLAEKSADINALDPAGRSALGRAVDSGNVEVAKLLKEAGADVHKAGEFGFKDTPAQMVMQQKDPALKSALMKAIGLSVAPTQATSVKPQRLTL